jgi:hypothetical protein
MDKNDLTQPRMIMLLIPFLRGLGNAKQLAIADRIKNKVFMRLIETNGIDADEDNPLYFSKFDLVQYAENELFKVASSLGILENRRDDIYKLYDKAAGVEKDEQPELSFEEKLRQLKNNLKKKPITKHQKK